MASQPIYQFYAELHNYNPKMWRKFQVANNVTMARLGYVLMTMFEMQASHLFCFDVPRKDNLMREITKNFSELELKRYLKNSEFMSRIDRNWHFEIINEYSNEYRDEKSEKLVDAVKTKVKNVVFVPGDKMVFNYDFGDNWTIPVVLEKIIIDKELSGKELPRVLEGEGFGIIEDCGGVGGLENIARAFKEKKGEQYENFCNWIGIEELDLSTFDVEDMNYRLKKVPRIYADCYEKELRPTQRSMDILERRYKR